VESFSLWSSLSKLGSFALSSSICLSNYLLIFFARFAGLLLPQKPRPLWQQPPLAPSFLPLPPLPLPLLHFVVPS
jgi:hypothetical protein